MSQKLEILNVFLLFCFVQNKQGTRVVQVDRRLLLYHETVYREFYEINMRSSAASGRHCVRVWIESQF